ncbi:TetR/AcrR family transcriptional regulator [Fredinandcohnia sp. 179-A 10B2 NHS]|uniref:TetR/AcrR family transcriptional regulator n=1 Tax=Fredinandcohnia sp. 179-A 10B2 NHS TaxID=3235176 RepID=UPI0039A3E45F
MPKVSDDYKEKRRYEILMAAEKVFIEKGFSGTTMTDIVTASGLSRGGLYHYFSNTDEVYQALLKERDSEANEYFENLLKDNQTAWGAMESFLSMVEQSLTHSKDSLAPVNLEYFIIGRHVKGRLEFINARFDAALGSLLNLLGTGVERGELAPIQPLHTIVNFLLNTIDAMHIQTIIMSSEKADIKGQVEAIRIYLKQALGAK